MENDTKKSATVSVTKKYICLCGCLIQTSWTVSFGISVLVSCSCNSSPRDILLSTCVLTHVSFT